MTSFPRLLCLAALATATAFAQTTVNPTLPSDSSLAVDVQPSLNQTSNVSPADSHPVHDARYYDSKPSAAEPGAAQVETDAASPVASAVPPPLQMRSNSGEVILPTATVLRLKLVRAISTATNRPGEQFFATLIRPVVIDGRTVIPAGTSVTCRIEAARGGRRLAGKPSISIKAFSVHLPSGEVLDFSASVIDTTSPRKLDVDQEGRIRGNRFNSMDKVEMGSLAGAGLITGAIVAGPVGLGVGVASGAAIATGHILIKRRELSLPAGTELIFELDAPATTGRPQMGG